MSVTGFWMFVIATFFNPSLTPGCCWKMTTTWHSGIIGMDTKVEPPPNFLATKTAASVGRCYPTLMSRSIYYNPLKFLVSASVYPSGKRTPVSHRQVFSTGFGIYSIQNPIIDSQLFVLTPVSKHRPNKKEGAPCGNDERDKHEFSAAG